MFYSYITVILLHNSEVIWISFPLVIFTDIPGLKTTDMSIYKTKLQIVHAQPS